MLPYGSWPTPITSEFIVRAAAGLSEVRVDGDDVWWSEQRPEEGGRTQLVRLSAGRRRRSTSCPRAGTPATELSSATSPVVITIGSTAADSTTTVVATSTTFPVPPTFAAQHQQPPTLPTPPPPPPARLEVAASVVELGRDRTEGAVTIGNSGGQQLDWATSSDNGLVSATPGGSLGPAATADVVISVSRAGLIEGEYAATVAILGAGQAVPITVRWWVERSPVVQLGVEPAGLADAATCPSDHKDLTAVVARRGDRRVRVGQFAATVVNVPCGPGGR